MTEIKDEEIPKSITIGKYQYSFKQRKANNNFSYRCKTRKCGIIISIDSVNLKKIINNNSIGELEYKIVSKKEHTCDKATNKTELSNVQTVSEMMNLAEQIIKQNIDKSLLWHYNNLLKNQINISKNQVKRILENQREINYPKDDSYLLDISKITISFSKTNVELQNIPFCFSNNVILNYESKKQEKYILFTSIFQLRKITDCEQIFMDGTFYSCPKNYYQLYNIIGKEKKTGIIIPISFILMSHKSYSLYYHVFNNIKTLILKNKIEYKEKELKFMMDFEKSSRKAIKSIFPESILLGCFFHFTKALWKKAKKEGLCKKLYMKETHIIIFAFKIFIFIKEKEKDNYLKQIEEFYKEKKEYKGFIQYFKKNWSNCNFLDFERCDQAEIVERTDNICELFHKNLNDKIDIRHPKISYLIEKLKEFTTEQFEKLVENMVLGNMFIEKSFNVYDDIFNFLKKIKQKYDKKLSIEFLNNLEEEEKKDLKELSIRIIKKVLNVEIDIDNDNNNNNLDNENEEENNIEELKENNKENEEEEEEKEEEENIDKSLSSEEEDEDNDDNIFNLLIKKKYKSKYSHTDFNIINDDDDLKHLKKKKY